MSSGAGVEASPLVASTDDADDRRGSLRADVQGLRGLAVLLVVAYHAGAPVPGGYVGVDVFFVVSGYVITRMLLGEVRRSGRVRFRTFYLRRIRRLLPALALMLSLTLLLSIGLAPIAAQPITARTGAAAALVNANTYLIRSDTDGGYFGVDAAANALIHTWSLSVEEQFYLAFPALLAAAALVARRRGRLPERAVGTMLAGVIVLSLPLSLLLTTGRLDPDGLGRQIAFYSAPTRAWEFAIGGILAAASIWVARVGRRPGVRATAAITGFLALAAAALLFDESTLFPGTAALVPVAGTALLIAAGETDGDLAATRALGWKPMTRLGDLSYSWYLWHWPLLVFTGALWPGSTGAKALVAVGSLGPAWLSYRLVENPIRFRPSPRTSRTLGLGVLCVATPLLCAVLLSVSHDRLTQTELWTPFETHADVQRRCDSVVPVSERSAACHWTVPGAQGDATLVGDSNAGQFTEGFVAAANAAGLDAVVATRSACTFVDIVVVDLDGDGDVSACRSFVEQSTADLVANPPDVVMIAGASDFYIELDRYEMRSPDGAEVFQTAETKAAAWEAGTRRMVDELSAAGIEVVIAAPVPRLPEGWAPIEMAPLRLRTPSLYDVSTERDTALQARARAVAAEAAAVGSRALVLRCVRRRVPDRAVPLLRRRDVAVP